jgi:hypothetical protein
VAGAWTCHHGLRREEQRKAERRHQCRRS